MAKIVEINKDLVKIMLDDNSYKVVSIDDLSCTPMVGKEVDVFSNGEVTIVKDKVNNLDEYHSDTSYEDISNETYGYDNDDNFNQDFNTFTYSFGLNKYKIKKFKYILLCIIGFTGIQRFLTGRITSGIVCLVCLLSGFLSFIPIIIWAYDLVVALFTPTDKDGNIYV